jgi:hypothetical protein
MMGLNIEHEGIEGQGHLKGLTTQVTTHQVQ